MTWPGVVYGYQHAEKDRVCGAPGLPLLLFWATQVDLRVKVQVLYAEMAADGVSDRARAHVHSDCGGQ